MENQQFPKRPRLSEPLPTRRSQQHKNEPCLKFQRGCCGYGDRCCFAHSVGEKHLIPAVDDEININNNSIRFSELKTRFCWRFMNGDKCQYGDKCHFIHVNINEVGEHQRKQLPWRKKLCIRWMATGCCKYGRNCCYAHGVSELQNQGPSYAQDNAGGGICKLVDKKVEGKPLKVKWQNNEKISGVYADWINDMPLVSHTM